MKLSGRERYMMIGGAIIAGAVIVINWIALPFYRSWAELGEKLAPKLALLEELEERVDKRDALLARRARLSRQMGSLLGGKKVEKGNSGGNPGPDSKGGGSSAPNPRSLEVEVAEMAKKSGAKLQLVYSKKPSRKARKLKYFREVALHVEASGKMESVTKMLHKLEKGDRLIRVDTLELHRKPDGRSPVNVTLEIAAYTTAAGREGGD